MFENQDMRKKFEDAEKKRVVEYSEKLSNCSCKISEIKGFIFGGFSSRFWMLRKQINSMELAEFEHQDFYCWESISIETSSREIDLVIKDKTHMDKFIKYLIYVLKTKDGSKGSALREYK